MDIRPIDIEAYVADVGRRARAASRAMARAPSAAKDRALAATAAAIRRAAPALQAANAKDLEAARAAGLDAAFVDRLALTDKVIESMAAGLEQIDRREHRGLHGDHAECEGTGRPGGHLGMSGDHDQVGGGSQAVMSLGVVDQPDRGPGFVVGELDLDGDGRDRLGLAAAAELDLERSWWGLVHGARIEGGLEFAEGPEGRGERLA